MFTCLSLHFGRLQTLFPSVWSHPNPTMGESRCSEAGWVVAVAAVLQPKRPVLVSVGLDHFPIMCFSTKSLASPWGPTLGTPSKEGQWTDTAAVDLALLPIHRAIPAVLPGLPASWVVCFSPCAALRCNSSRSFLLFPYQLHTLALCQGHLKSSSTFTFLRAGVSGHKGREVHHEAI